MDKHYYLIAILAILILLLILRKCIYIIKSRKFYAECNSVLQINRINKELEGSGFEFDDQQEIFVSRHDAWQRRYGYRELFDEMAPSFNMIIDCEPIRFDYDERKWLIELWKGQYAMAAGGEIGVYVSNDGRHYNCVGESEELYMSFVLMDNDKILFRRYDRHWWLTGFLLGKYIKPHELKMVAEINFIDGEMCINAINALRKMGYDRRNMWVSRNSVRISFEKPLSKQPNTRKGIFAKMRMKMNKINCRIYNKYTKKYKYTLDKIGYIKIRVPKIYKIIVSTLNVWKKING